MAIATNAARENHTVRGRVPIRALQSDAFAARRSIARPAKIAIGGTEGMKYLGSKSI
jgi:hypothetical protein